MRECFMIYVSCFMIPILIPSLLIAAGVALAVRVVYKKIPNDRINWDEAVAKEDFGPTFYQKALAAVSLKTKQSVLSASTKFIYKLKITSLKTDNFFSRLLKEMKEHKSSVDEVAPQPDVPLEASSLQNKFRVQITSVEEPGPVSRISIPVNPQEIADAGVHSSFEAQEHQLINQLAYNPKDVAAYKHLGWLYMENNKPLEARQAFKMAIKLGSRDKIIMAKLLEVGGVLHKEGTAVARSTTHSQPVVIRKVVAVETKANVAANPVFTQKGGVKTKKEVKPKTRKLKVRKV